MTNEYVAAISKSDKKVITNEDDEYLEDVAYFQNKLLRCREHGSIDACKKIQAQLDGLLDSLVIYKISRSSERRIIDSDGMLMDLD
jgi:hypothetical protein